MTKDGSLEVGLIADGAHARTLTECLGPLSRVRTLGADVAADELSALDVVVVYLAPLTVEGVRVLARLRALSPATPVVLAAPDIAVDVAGELIRQGIADVTSFPDEGALLWPKVLRAANRTAELLLASPVLEPLLAAARVEGGAATPAINKRAGHRVNVPDAHRVFAEAMVSPKPARFRIVSVSLHAGERRAGLLLEELPTAPADREQFGVGATFALVIETPAGASNVRGVLTRIASGAKARFRVGVACEFPSMRDEALLQRVWVDAQRVAVRTGTEPNLNARQDAASPVGPRRSGR